MNSFWSPKLGDVAEAIDYGVTASATDEQVGPHFLRITDIQNGSVDWDAVPFCHASPKKLSAAKLADGDIVFARTGATTGKSFLVRSPPEGAVFASYLIRVRPSSSIDPSYLAHYFQSSGYWAQIRAKAQGAAQEGVNATKLADLSIPLPPLDEQRRIAAILDKADALRQKRKRVIALLDSLMQSIFLEMFGALLSGGKSQPLVSLVSSIDYGVTESAVFEPVGPHFLRITDIQDGQVDWNTVPYCPQSQKAEKAKLASGDIVFARTGATTGKSFLVVSPPTNAVFASYLIRVRPGSKLDSQFLFGFFQTAVYWNYIMQSSRGAAQGGVNATSLGNMQIPLAPMHSQLEYSRAVSRVSKVREKHVSTRLHEDALFSSLQHRAFSGQL